MAQTVALTTNQYNTLGFDLIYGNGTNGGDAIDGNNDRVRLEYSTNNGLAWQVLQEFAASGNWSRFNVNLPPEAQSTSTLLRWVQPQNDGAGTDAWAIDNIALTTDPLVTVSQLSLSPLTPALNEGNSGSTPFTFSVTRSGNITGASTALWSVAPLTGIAGLTGADFVGGSLPSGAVAFAAGETSKTLTVNVAGDKEIESNENFQLALSAPSVGTTLGTATATGTIFNDDTAINISPSSVTGIEGATGASRFSFTI